MNNRPDYFEWNKFYRTRTTDYDEGDYDEEDDLLFHYDADEINIIDELDELDELDAEEIAELKEKHATEEFLQKVTIIHDNLKNHPICQITKILYDVNYMNDVFIDVHFQDYNHSFSEAIKIKCSLISKKGKKMSKDNSYLYFDDTSPIIKSFMFYDCKPKKIGAVIFEIKDVH